MTFCAFSLNAQEIITLKKGEKLKELKKGTHIKIAKPILENITGIWEFKSANKSFRLKIINKKTEINGCYIDILSGNYCFNDKVCNLEKTDSIDYNDLNFEGNPDKMYDGKFEFIIYDKRNDKFGKVILKILENGKAKWRLLERGGVTIANKHKKDFSIPSEMILKKIK